MKLRESPMAQKGPTISLVTVKELLETVLDFTEPGALSSRQTSLVVGDGGESRNSMYLLVA